jgi:hypothetical protein
VSGRCDRLYASPCTHALMRLYKLKKCRNIQELRFTPDGGQLLVVHGYEVSSADGAISLNLATGVPSNNLSFALDIRVPSPVLFMRSRSYTLANDLSRVVISRTAYVQSLLPNAIQWCDPREESPVWNAMSLNLTWPEGEGFFSFSPFHLSLTRDGNRLFVLYGWERVVGGHVSVWTHHYTDCRLDMEKRWRVFDVESRIKAAAFTRDGSRIAMSWGQDRESHLALYPEPGSKPLVEVSVPGLRIGKIAFSPDGANLAAINSSNTVILMTADRLETIGTLSTNSRKHVTGFAFSPDGSRIITGASDGTIRVWDTDRAELIQSYDWNIGPVAAVDFSNDGTLCAAGGKGGRIVVWDVD